ncbi:MAG TPA: TorF family putative porin [Croceibacterium sp.]|nr:TorF family putative porin [Croceibacterium sp.]
MLTSVRSLTAATLLASSAFAAAPAFAQDEALGSTAGVTVSANVAVVTDYRFRGVSLSGGDAAIQGGIDLKHDSGFYAGTWGSSIQGGTAYGDMELDLYAGWTGNVSEAVTVDVGLLYYLYPSGDDAAFPGVDTDYFEPYASIATTIGPVGATAGVAYAWDQAGLGGNDNLYLYTDFTLGVPTTPVTVNAHLGYTDGVLAPPFLTGTADDTGLDWSLGATATVWNGLSVGVSYVGVDGPSVDGFTDDTVVGTLSFAI